MKQALAANPNSVAVALERLLLGFNVDGPIIPSRAMAMLSVTSAKTGDENARKVGPFGDLLGDKSFDNAALQRGCRPSARNR
jgi:hypothetical protein